jgi:hypothetical protein
MYQLNTKEINQVSGGSTGDVIMCTVGTAVTAFEVITGQWWAAAMTGTGTVAACIDAYNDAFPEKTPNVEAVPMPDPNPEIDDGWQPSLPDEPSGTSGGSILQKSEMDLEQ